MNVLFLYPHLPAISRFEIGSFEDWVGTRLYDHVPLVLDIDFCRQQRLSLIHI